VAMNSGGGLSLSIHIANDDQNHDGDPQRAMDRNQHMVVGQRSDHRNADEQHRQNHRRHRPVQEPGEQRELPAASASSYSLAGTHWRISAGVTALGSLVSPARRVKDCE
jgi:hypothetical protein